MCCGSTGSKGPCNTTVKGERPPSTTAVPHLVTAVSVNSRSSELTRKASPSWPSKVPASSNGPPPEEQIHPAVLGLDKAQPLVPGQGGVVALNMDRDRGTPGPSRRKH